MRKTGRENDNGMDIHSNVKEETVVKKKKIGEEQQRI